MRAHILMTRGNDAGAGLNSFYADVLFKGDTTTPADPGWVEPAWDGMRLEYSRLLGKPLVSANTLSEHRRPSMCCNSLLFYNLLLHTLAAATACPHAWMHVCMQMNACAADTLFSLLRWWHHSSCSSGKCH